MTKIIKKFGLLSIMFLFLLNVNAKAETWRIQAHLPSGHTVYQFIDDWVKEVNTMLGGRLTLELYPAKAIIPPFETLEAVQMGIIDADITSPAYFAGRDPAIPLLADLIGAYSNWLRLQHGVNTVEERSFIKKCMISLELNLLDVLMQE